MASGKIDTGHPGLHERTAVVHLLHRAKGECSDNVHAATFTVRKACLAGFICSWYFVHTAFLVGASQTHDCLAGERPCKPCPPADHGKIEHRKWR